MKKLFSTLIITALAFGAANAQAVLMSEDFAGGIPASWSNVGTANGGNPAAVKFHYTSNQTAGSGGAYGSSYGTISSPTKSNGYITFDSDSLDEGGGAGSMGNGPAPAPQHCELTTSAINVAGHPNVRVSFYQYLANFRAVTSVAYSNDSINWTIDTLNADQDGNSATALADEKINKDVSSIIAGQNKLYIRFIWDGEYYFWALDDINVIETPLNDLAVTSFAARSLTPTAEGLDLAFSVYPKSQADSITPVVIYTNQGRAAQTNTRADITLKRGTTTVASYTTTPGFTLPAGVDTIDYVTQGRIDTIGSYKSIVYVHSDSLDYDLTNNTDSFSFLVTDSVYSINTGSVSSSVYFLLRNNYGLSYRLGNLFEVKSTDTVTSITTAVSGGQSGSITFTKAGAVLKATVYPITVGSSSLSYGTAAVATFPTTVASNQLTTTTLRPITMKIDYSTGNPVLAPGLYWVAVEAVSTPDSNVAILATQYQENAFPISEDFTAPGTLYYFSSTDAPYVNMNFGHASSLLYADFTRNPGVNPLRSGQPVAFTAISNANTTTATYDWTFTGSPNVGYAYNSQTGRIVRDTFYVTQDDTINVCLTITDGTSVTTCKSMRVRALGVGVEDVSAISNVSMVPNPTTGKVTISAEGITGATTVSITNAIGQEVKHFNETANGTFSKAYNVSDLAGGLYIVKIQNGTNTATSRLSISK